MEVYFMSANVETMFSVREVPWHGLGTIVQEAVSSEEAIKLAGLDWDVRQEEIVYYDQNTGYFMNIRSSDQKVLGVVGGRYKPVQNEEAFSFVDNLLGIGVTYETAGSLASGKRVWLLAKLPVENILGDEVEPYLVLTNSHDGFGSLKVAMTPVRVVCQNTLNLALDHAKRMWNVRHTGNIDSKLKAAQETLGLADKYMERLKLEAEALAALKISEADYIRLTDKLFPINDEMTKRKQESQDVLRLQLKHAWEQDDLGNIRGTGYGFINAVSDMSTHKPALRDTENAQENKFMATIDAPVLLDLAHKLVRELV